MPLGKAISQGKSSELGQIQTSLQMKFSNLSPNTWYHDNLLAMLLFVFVILRCYNKIPLNGIKHNIYFSQLWGWFKIKVLTESVPGEDSPLALQMANFCCISQGRDRKSSLVSLLIKTIIPSWGPHFLDLIHLIISQLPCLQITSYWRLVIQHKNFGRKQTFGS